MDFSRISSVTQVKEPEAEHVAPTNAFTSALFGPGAFYKHPEYLEITKKEFSQKKILPVSYTLNSERKIFRVVKQVLCVIIFPIGLYQLIHSFIGSYILPASSTRVSRLKENYGELARKEFAEKISADDAWKYKRFTVEVDGYKIDAALMGKVSTFTNGRWLLNSCGNCQFYEDILRGEDVMEFRQILTETESNAIIFNYPGVANSSGLPNQEAMVKAYKAMLNLLEDKREGIGAIEIIGYGHSIGAGVQGEFLKNAELREGVDYVFVKSRTFSTLPEAISSVASKFLGILAIAFGWDMGSVESSKNLNAPEIIIQTARVPRTQEILDPVQVADDNIIPADVSLAHALLKDAQNVDFERKIFIGIRESHNTMLNPHTVTFLTEKIKGYFEVA